jgi:hypothetical protein
MASAGVIDSQSVPGAATVGKDSRGYDAGKKVNGRKRHLVVDTGGLLLVVLVTAASVQDRDGGVRVLDRAIARPRYAGGRPPKFDLSQRAQIKKIALARPADHGLPFSVWSLSKLADFLVAEGVVEDISHEGLRVLLREPGVSFPSRQDLEDQHRP